MPVVSAASARASAGSMPLHLPRRPPRRKLGSEESTTAGVASSEQVRAEGAGHVKPTASGQRDHDALYRAQHGRVRSLCRLLLADHHEAEEVCQEVFVKL